jgi:hypothetical protein
MLLLGAVVLGLALSAAVAVPILARHRPEANTPVLTSPADYYRLAQECERKGEIRDALAAYEHCLAMNENCIEPPLAYLRLLRSSMDAETAAKQFHATCGPFAGNVVYDLVALRLLDGEARRLAMEKFTGENPDFALAHFDLADCYSAEEMPNRSKVAEARERACLTRAVALAEHEDFGRYFIDKGLANVRLEDARRRLSASTNMPLLANVGVVQFHPPSLIYVIDPCAAKILYSVDGKSWTEAKGFKIQGGAMRWAAAGVTKEDAQRLLQAAQEASSHKATLHVKYTDNRGLESDASEFAPDSSEFNRGLPTPLSKFNLPKIKIPDIPQLPEEERRMLREIQNQLPAALRDDPSENKDEHGTK